MEEIMSKKLALLGGPPTVREIKSGYDFHSKLWEEGKIISWEKFSEACAEKFETKYALPVSSGTAALVSALASVGVGPGDEVIVPSFTWIASVSCIVRSNAIPIFADIDPKTLTLDPKSVEEKITDRTKVIIAVDLYGHPAPLLELKKMAEKHNLFLIEDACQASGASINGRCLGGIADVTAFSFSGKPVYSTSGGVMVTNDKRTYQKAALVGQHPAYLSKIITEPDLVKYISAGTWIDNFRIDKYAMTLAYERLQEIDELNEHRIKNCEFLTKELENIEGIIPPYKQSNVKHVYHMYTCLYDEEKFGVPRDVFAEALYAEGVPTINYVDSSNFFFHPGGKPVHGGAIHHRAVFQELNVYGKGCPFKCPFGVTPKYEEESLPITERIVKQEFNWMQPHLSYPNDQKVMEQILEVVAKVVRNIGQLEGYQLKTRTMAV